MTETCYLCWKEKPESEMRVISSSYGNVCRACVAKEGKS